MANAFTGDVITASLPYWYSRLPYTVSVALGAGGQTNLTGPVTGYNTQESPGALVTLETVHTALDPNLVLRVQADQQTLQLYTAAHPPGFRPVPVGARAVQSLTLSAYNPGSATSLPSSVLYSVSVWRLPLTMKILLGYAITSDEQALAQRLGLDISPVAMNGQFPIPLSAVIERTYANRLIGSPLIYDGPPLTFPPGGGQVSLPPFSVPPNALYVLRSVAVPMDADYGPTVQIDRDANESFVQFDPSVSPEPVDLFLPALQRIQIRVSVTSPPPGPVPIRVVLWPVSLSNILRVRLGLITETGLVQVFQAAAEARAAAEHRTPTAQELQAAAAAAETFYLKVLAGVM
jgi:hypothetical protein